MKVVSNENKILNAEVTLTTIDSVYGLVLESRGGTKGEKNERNTDYIPAFDILLQRLLSANIRVIRVFVCSSALSDWTMDQRELEVDAKRPISMLESEPGELRKKICKAQQDKKKDSKTKGGSPTKRILINCGLNADGWHSVINGSIHTLSLSETDIESVKSNFDPNNIEEVKAVVIRSIADRRGQPKFRKNLIKEYLGTCAITGCSIPELLEAAHIIPYRGNSTNHITNGILLRTDIHTLFDLGLVGTSEEYKVKLDTSLKESEYSKYDGGSLKLPVNKEHWPCKEALKTRPIPK